ncbi:MAG: carbohydrate ABC transporter permease [Clostridiaceae bacterium]|nr:carbohydrate ABC transporter permease [Clostridiaceae bacterium]
MYKETTGGKIFRVINTTIILFIVVITVMPFILVVNGSIVSENEFFRTGGVIFIPRSFSARNYKFIFTEGSILSSFWISVQRVVIGVPFAMLLTIILAYAMTKKDMPGYRLLMLFMVFMMYFDGGLIPRLLLYKDLGLYNNFLVYIFPMGISVFNALLLRNFINTIPESLPESARLDGASESTILFRIILPLAKPGIATVSLFVAVAHWNDWFTAIAYMRQGINNVPMQTYLRKMVTLSQLELDAMGVMQDMITPTPETLKMAAIVATTVPIVIVYPFIQKYFVKGILIGSVKE